MDLEVAQVQELPQVPVASTSKAPASIFATIKDYPTIRDGSLVIVYLVSIQKIYYDIVD